MRVRWVFVWMSASAPSAVEVKYTGGALPCFGCLCGSVLWSGSFVSLIWSAMGCWVWVHDRAGACTFSPVRKEGNLLIPGSQLG